MRNSSRQGNTNHEDQQTWYLSTVKKILDYSKCDVHRPLLRFYLQLTDFFHYNSAFAEADLTSHKVQGQSGDT